MPKDRLTLYQPLNLTPSSDEMLFIAFNSPVSLSTDEEGRITTEKKNNMEWLMSIAKAGEEIKSIIQVLMEEECASQKRCLKILQERGFSVPQRDKIMRQLRELWEVL